MAALTKHVASSVANHLKHNCRAFAVDKEANNPNIYHEKTCENYSFSLPKKGDISLEKIPVISPSESRAYYKERLDEIYHMNRKDLVVCFEWCITLPKELSSAPEETKLEFFQQSFKFLCNKYGGENCVQVVVHRDEGILDKSGNRILGSDHMHAMFMPVTKVTIKDPKRTESKFEEKLNCKTLISKTHLKTFHSDFQRYLDSNTTLSCRVETGVTQGNNRTVDELKEETRLQSKIAALEKENNVLKERVATLEKELEKVTNKEQEITHGWGTESTSAWGTIGGSGW